MKRSLARVATMSVAAAGLLIVPSAPARAHEHRDVGEISMVTGWAVEPAYAAYTNSVQLFLNHHGEGGEEEGPPIEDAAVQVEVIFGDQDAEERTEPLDLEPAFDSPGEYLAPIIPTRPGTYTFHFTGDVDGQEIDEFFTSGPETFGEIEAPTDIQFPAQDPSAGDLARAVEEVRSDNTALTSQLQEAEDAAGSARTMAIAGIVVGVLGIVVAIVAVATRGKRSTA